MRKVKTGFTVLQRIIAWTSTLAVCGFIILIVGTYIFSCVAKPAIPPAIKEAPWLIQTSSRVYYASQYEIVNGVSVITDYWVMDAKEHYRFIKGTMSFPKREFGQIAVIRRRE